MAQKGLKGGASPFPTLRKAVASRVLSMRPFDSGNFFFQQVLLLKIATAHKQSFKQAVLQSSLLEGLICSKSDSGQSVSVISIKLNSSPDEPFAGSLRISPESASSRSVDPCGTGEVVIACQTMKNQTPLPDVELECGGRVVFPFKAWVPLNGEANDEIVKDMTVIVKDLVDPFIHLGASLGDGDQEVVAVKVNLV
nr:hypothetical protein Iba_chr07fCG6880 [Ipomoea batatas]